MGSGRTLIQYGGGRVEWVHKHHTSFLDQDLLLLSGRRRTELRLVDDTN